MKKSFYLIAIIFLLACNASEKKKQADQVQEYVQETQVEYYPDGKLKMEGNTVNGKAHGVWKYYFENGFIWSEGQFRHGVRDGYARIYYENGKKRMQGQYEAGKKTGWWRVWDTDGSFVDSINIKLALSGRDSLLLGLK
jgi:antitoxin component YwqK of YwqJK toxin-antitoxin module